MFSGQSVSKGDGKLLLFFTKCKRDKELTNKTKELLLFSVQNVVTLQRENNKVLSQKK
jgi:hypothetical protein